MMVIGIDIGAAGAMALVEDSKTGDHLVDRPAPEPVGIALVGIYVSNGVSLRLPTAGKLNVVDLPILRDGPKGRPSVNPPLFADQVRWVRP